MIIFSLLQFIEGFSLYLIISTLAGLKERVSLIKILFLSVLHGTIYYIIDKIFPFQLHAIILIILSIIFSTLLLEIDIIISIISALISTLIIITMDFLVSLCFLTIFHFTVDDLLNNYLIRNSLTFIVELAFLGIGLILFKKNVNLSKKFFINKKTSLFLSSLFFFLCIFAVLGFIICTYIKDSQPIIYIFLIITFISFSFVLYKLHKYILSATVKEIQLEDQSIYIEYIKELMNNLKSQRHEFVNHINVLYGLVQFKDIKHLETAKKYIESLNMTIQGTSNIMATDEPVVSGLLFTKTAIAEQKNIEMDIHITNRITDTSLSLTEISTVLNNLINNAIEFSESLPEEKRYISIEIVGDEQKIYLEVCNENNGKYITDIDAIFKKGFSTKSNDSNFRGFGLYNVKTIICKHNGLINVQSDLYETSFKITLPKKQK